MSPPWRRRCPLASDRDEARSKRGRPPRAGRNATEVVQVRMTPAERQAIEAVARAAGTNVSAYIRTRIGLAS